jgi:outer membrane protein OmpA-like peptidoglycan-associated protein
MFGQNPGHPLFLPAELITILPETQVNTDNLEFSPCWFDNGLLYISNSRSSKGIIDRQIREPFFRIFFAPRDESGLMKPGRPIEFSDKNGFHHGPASYDINSGTLYFSRNNSDLSGKRKDSQGEIRMNLYSSEYDGKSFDIPKRLSFCTDEYSYTNPSLSKDGSTLVFSSDMDGGYGGMDLYVSYQHNGAWSTPINLGSHINSAGHESFPFIHESGRLIFASDKSGGQGGFDMYISEPGPAGWEVPKALSQVFNSSRDDFGLILDESGNSGYFTSNRKGSEGKDDIYNFSVTSPEKVIDDLSIIVHVLDEKSGSPLENTSVYVKALDGFSIADIEQSKLNENQQDKAWTLSFEQQTAIDQNDFDGLTDVQGQRSISLPKSHLYALVVKKEGFETGIKIIDVSPELLKKSYFFSLVEDCEWINFEINSSSATSIENATIKITESNGVESILTSGNDGKAVFCRNQGESLNVLVEKEGYNSRKISVHKVSPNSLTRVFLDKIMVKVDPVEAIPTAETKLPIARTRKITEVEIKDVSKGDLLLLENLYYDYNKSDIKLESGLELDKLVQIMNASPEMEIELSAHTDCRGQDNYNLNLSLERAENAKKYLISKGISAERIFAFGYGESKIRNGCTDGVECSDEDHAYNRRTEVVILKK